MIHCFVIFIKYLIVKLSSLELTFAITSVFIDLITRVIPISFKIRQIITSR